MVAGENILLHVGQAGCQIGFACWELLSLEHGIYADGTLATEFGHERESTMIETKPFFQETNNGGKFVPRALFFDLDPHVISQIRLGTHQSLFNPDFLVSGLEDACNNFARGFYSMGCDYIDDVMERIRRMVEVTDNLNGFMMVRSNCGGTGGGFGSLMLTKLTEEYPTMPRYTLEVNHSDHFSLSPVECYNSVLTCHASMENVSCTFMCDNEKMYQIFDRYLGTKCTSYRDTNQLIAQVLSGLTASFRSTGSLNTNISELQVNLVAYPRVHFPVLSYAPVTRKDYRKSPETFAIDHIIRNLFDSTNQMMGCNTRKGRTLASCLLFRGGFTTNEVVHALERFKTYKLNSSRSQLMSWGPGEIKFGANDSPGLVVPGCVFAGGCRSGVGILSNTAVKEVFASLTAKFDLMYYRKAYIHWYNAEGVECEELDLARMDMEALLTEFVELEKSAGGAVKEITNYGNRSSSTYSGGVRYSDQYR